MASVSPLYKHLTPTLNNYFTVPVLYKVEAGAYMGCRQMANTNNPHTKNEILVETIGSTFFSGFSSIGLGILFAANPVGWVVVLTLGTAAALGSYGAGKGAVWVYNNKKEKVDLSSQLGIDQLCH